MKTFTKQLIPALAVMLFSGLGLATSHTIESAKGINFVFVISLAFFLGMILYIVALYKEHKKKLAENEKRKSK